MKKEQEEIDLEIELGKEAAEKFLYIKDRLGLETDKDVLTYLINESYQRSVSKGEVEKPK